MDPSSAKSDPGIRDLVEMWEALLAVRWASLAVLPTDQGTSVELVTRSFSQVAGNQPRGTLRLLDARGLTVPEGERMTADVKQAVEEGVRVVVVVDPVTWSLAGIPLVRESEQVLLVVRVGDADPDSLSSTIGIVGPERIMGSVAVPSPG